MGISSDKLAINQRYSLVCEWTNKVGRANRQHSHMHTNTHTLSTSYGSLQHALILNVGEHTSIMFACLQNRLPITQHFGKVRSLSKQSHIYFNYLRNSNRCHAHPYHYLIYLFCCAILLLCAILNLLLLHFCRFTVIHPDICHLYWGNVVLLFFCFVTLCCLMSVTSPSACSQT